MCVAADIRKVRQARFATAVRLLENVDAAGLRVLLHNLPAWIRFSDFEQAK